MAALRSLRKHWYWAGLLALGGAVAAAALIAPGDIGRLLTAITLLLLSAGVALQPALALMRDREWEAELSDLERYDAFTGPANRNTSSDSPAKAMGEIELSRTLPLLQDQDRPPVHQSHDTRPCDARDRPDHHHARQVARYDNHR